MLLIHSSENLSQELKSSFPLLLLEENLFVKTGRENFLEGKKVNISFKMLEYVSSYIKQTNIRILCNNLWKTQNMRSKWFYQV